MKNLKSLKKIISQYFELGFDFFFFNLVLVQYFNIFFSSGFTHVATTYLMKA